MVPEASRGGQMSPRNPRIGREASPPPQLQPATDTDVPGRYRPGRLPRPAAGVRAGTESCHCAPPTPARRGLLRFGKERGPEGRLRPSHLKGPGVYRRHTKL